MKWISPLMIDKLTKSQKILVINIKNKMLETNPSLDGVLLWHIKLKMENYVWYNTFNGCFYWDDKELSYDIIGPLINKKILLFDGIEKIHGDEMVRYVLSPYFFDII